MTDDLTLIAGGREISGWQEIRVTRGIERCPNDFDITMTERYPGDEMVVVSPGDACIVRLGTDTVITGYVDRYTSTIRAGQHEVHIAGRGRCADLVDCSAEWPGAQIVNSTVLGIAQKLCGVYGNDGAYPALTAYALAGVGDPVPLLAVMIGESAYEIIERVCRFAGLLAYEDPNGLLVLSAVGTGKAASGFSEGINVEFASIGYTMDQRFSEYDVVRQNVDALQDLGQGSNLIAKNFDAAVRRHRLRYIIAETGDTQGYPNALKRGIWECNRRIGRSMQLHVTTDGWRDGSGALYAPNTLVDLDLPTIKVPAPTTWLIGEVSYLRDEGGTRAELAIMPPSAFMPEPVILAPGLADVPAL